MIIVRLSNGLGNQMYQYAAGRRLAHKWGTELKFHFIRATSKRHERYRLGEFNIRESFATLEEIIAIKKLRAGSDLGKEHKYWEFVPEALNWPDNVYLDGMWQYEQYFADIADILKREFTLKNPLGAAAQRWQEKIFAAECSVSIHVRRGDYLNFITKFGILSLSYYKTCVAELKKTFPNITVFVFSDDIDWCRENFQFDVPTEFVAGDGLTDVEEFHLMSRCQHNIIANSTFSWWAAWLNPNPNKKVFASFPWFKADSSENGLPAAWTKIPVNFNSIFDEDTPLLSIIVYIRNNADNLSSLITNIFNQTFKDYELILIDDGSDDGSEHLCRQVASNPKVTLITSGGYW